MPVLHPSLRSLYPGLRFGVRWKVAVFGWDVWKGLTCGRGRLVLMPTKVMAQKSCRYQLSNSICIFLKLWHRKTTVLESWGPRVLKQKSRMVRHIFQILCWETWSIWKSSHTLTIFFGCILGDVYPLRCIREIKISNIIQTYSHRKHMNNYMLYQPLSQHNMGCINICIMY